MERFCEVCGREIVAGLPGQYCLSCQWKRQPSVVAGRYYDISDMAARLCLREEQVRRLARAGKLPGRILLIKRHLFPKSIIDAWLAGKQQPSYFPSRTH